MYHQTTPDNKKKEILIDMMTQGQIKVLLCSSSFSMGVHLRGVSICILYGVPDSSEALLQMAGRVAREPDSSGQVIMLSFTHMRSGRKVSPSIHKFLAGKVCRRAALYDGLSNVTTRCHSEGQIMSEQEATCCDVCNIHLPNVLKPYLEAQLSIVSQSSSGTMCADDVQTSELSLLTDDHPSSSTDNLSA